MDHRWLGTTLGLMLLAPLAHAKTNTPTQPPPPSAELKQLDFFSGEWKCTGRMFDTPAGPGYSFQATVKGQPILGGQWYSIEYTQKATKQSPEVVTRGLWGWVPQKKELTRTFVDNMGAIDQATSPGWQGDKMDWSGQCNCTGEMAPFRHTFTKQGDTQVSDSFEVKTKDTWQPFVENTCKKTGKLSLR